MYYQFETGKGEIRYLQLTTDISVPYIWVYHIHSKRSAKDSFIIAKDNWPETFKVLFQWIVAADSKVCKVYLYVYKLQIYNILKTVANNFSKQHCREIRVTGWNIS